MFIKLYLLLLCQMHDIINLIRGDALAQNRRNNAKVESWKTKVVYQGVLYQQTLGSRTFVHVKRSTLGYYQRSPKAWIVCLYKWMYS